MMDAATKITTHGWEGAPGAGHELGPGFLARSQLVERWVRKLRPRALLEVGCGRGHLTNRLAGQCGRVVGLDLSPRAAALARHACARHRNVDVVLAEIGALPFHGTFDVIVLAEVLEHLDDDRAGLAAASSLLALDGQMIVTVPANPAFWTEQDVLAGHRRRYTRASLLELMAAGGFEPEELVSWGFPFTLQFVLRGGSRAARYREAGRASLPALMRLARAVYAPLARPIARVEYLLSGLDKGVGYALLARRREGGGS
jgi:2-polyprenyl-3-methyl-5-hydroxy-6-metoxy-1,4-benzoquinol methylase